MQGGVRRKKDLLPRYKNGSGGRGRNDGSILTTPMKKIIIYFFVLLCLFFMLRFAYSGVNKDIAYELDHSSSMGNKELLENGGTLNIPKEPVPVPKEPVAKDKFNNEVAKQQEVKNLENEFKPPPAEPKRVDNDVKLNSNNKLKNSNPINI